MLKRSALLWAPIIGSPNVPRNTSSTGGSGVNTYASSSVGRRPLKGHENEESAEELRQQKPASSSSAVGRRPISPSPSPRSAPNTAASASTIADKSPRIRPQKIGLFVRLQAKYLGVDPYVLVRYGDGSQRSRYLRYLYMLLLAGGCAATMNGSQVSSSNMQYALKYTEDNRKRFYGHDFDQPMGDVTRNFKKSASAAKKGDHQLILDADEKTGLMETTDGRFIAPSNYERDALQGSAIITQGMMDRISNLNKLQSGYSGSSVDRPYEERMQAARLK